MPRVTPHVIVVASVVLVWCLVSDLRSPQAWAASGQSTSPTSKPAVKRSLSFTLENESVNGTIPFGSELILGIDLSGGPPSPYPLVAVVEGAAIDNLMVPMEATGTPSHWKASVAITPRPLGYTSVRPKALRLRVTISQIRGTTLQRLIGRTAYLTLAHDPSEGPDHAGGETQVDLLAVPLLPSVGNTQADESPAAATLSASGDEIQPDVPPVANALIAEEDLKPLPENRGQHAYWREIARLISRSWGQKVRYAKGVHSARETVRVAFRMHPNGEAQLIQVERTSGVRDVDEAGLQAIVHAHPFPPFRDMVGDEVVDVHVRMRTGAKPATATKRASPSGPPVEVQPVGPQAPKPNAESKPVP